MGGRLYILYLDVVYALYIQLKFYKCNVYTPQVSSVGRDKECATQFKVSTIHYILVHSPTQKNSCKLTIKEETMLIMFLLQKSLPQL